ncbi:hypothetical protein BKA70DRAFT_1239834 [Coprinopsis sp. MPI-PUGE-AT-0042]|nr:hypothetical protein BKA70DRAFT_1239834 [Coprinopsis sp. MPI-PUGE-AT-0042]
MTADWVIWSGPPSRILTRMRAGDVSKSIRDSIQIVSRLLSRSQRSARLAVLSYSGFTFLLEQPLAAVVCIAVPPQDSSASTRTQGGMANTYSKIMSRLVRLITPPPPIMPKLASVPDPLVEGVKATVEVFDRFEEVKARWASGVKQKRRTEGGVYGLRAVAREGHTSVLAYPSPLHTKIRRRQYSMMKDEPDKGEGRGLQGSIFIGMQMVVNSIIGRRAPLYHMTRCLDGNAEVLRQALSEGRSSIRDEIASSVTRRVGITKGSGKETPVAVKRTKIGTQIVYSKIERWYKNGSTKTDQGPENESSTKSDRGFEIDLSLTAVTDPDVAALL